MNWKWNGVYFIFFFSYISLVSLPMPMGIILFSQSPSVPIDSLTASCKLWPAPGVNAMQYASSSSCSHLKASESNTLDPGPCFMINPYPPPPPPQFHDQSLITPPPHLFLRLHDQSTPPLSAPHCTNTNCGILYIIWTTASDMLLLSLCHLLGWAFLLFKTCFYSGFVFTQQDYIAL